MPDGACDVDVPAGRATGFEALFACACGDGDTGDCCRGSWIEPDKADARAGEADGAPLGVRRAAMLPGLVLTCDVPLWAGLVLCGTGSMVGLYADWLLPLAEVGRNDGGTDGCVGPGSGQADVAEGGRAAALPGNIVDDCAGLPDAAGVRTGLRSAKSA